MGFSGFRVSTRIYLLIGLTLLGLLTLCFTALYQLKDTMMEDRKIKLRNLVEIAAGVIDQQHKLVGAGKLSEEDAKKSARDILRGLRFDKEDYYFGIDTKGV